MELGAGAGVEAGVFGFAGAGDAADGVCGPVVMALSGLSR